MPIPHGGPFSDDWDLPVVAKNSLAWRVTLATHETPLGVKADAVLR